MTPWSDVKFKGKLTCGLKNDMRNLVNFHAGSQKPEIVYSDVLLLLNVYRVVQRLGCRECGGVKCLDTKEQCKI